MQSLFFISLNKFIPAITFVCYYGDEEWDTHLSLKEILKFPEGWGETLSDGERYYEKLIDEQGEKEVYDMCQAFEDMVEEGREQGVRENLQDNIRKMYKKGMTPEFIADVLEKDLELVKELLSE